MTAATLEDASAAVPPAPSVDWTKLFLGFGGMVSFGHAVYIGIGGYTVGILAHHGVTNGFVQWPLALTL